MKAYKIIIEFLKENWMIILAFILILFLLTRLDVPPSWK